MNAPPERVHLVRQWVEKAEEDLLVAEHTLKLGDDCPYAVVGFHAQQSVEKYLKAVLIFHAIAFPRTHDLTDLLRRIPAWAALDLQVEEISMLNNYAVQNRYPGEWEPVTRQEAEEALDKARQIRTKVQALLPGRMT